MQVTAPRAPSVVGSSKTWITTNVAAQVIKNSPGVLRAIVINPGVTSSVAIYDHASAGSNQVWGCGTATPNYAQTILFGPDGINMASGIVITTTGGTPAQILVIWD